MGIFFATWNFSFRGYPNAKNFTKHNGNFSQIWKFFDISTFARVEKYTSGTMWFSFPKKLFSDDRMCELLLCVRKTQFICISFYEVITSKQWDETIFEQAFLSHNAQKIFGTWSVFFLNSFFDILFKYCAPLSAVTYIQRFLRTSL